MSISCEPDLVRSYKISTQLNKTVADDVNKQVARMRKMYRQRPCSIQYNQIKVVSSKLTARCSELNIFWISCAFSRSSCSIWFDLWPTSCVGVCVSVWSINESISQPFKQPIIHTITRNAQQHSDTLYTPTHICTMIYQTEMHFGKSTYQRG